MSHSYRSEDQKSRKVSVPLILLFLGVVIGAGLFFFLREPVDNIPVQTAGTSVPVPVDEEPLLPSSDQETQTDAPEKKAQEPRDTEKKTPRAVSPSSKPLTADTPKKATQAPAMKKASAIVTDVGGITCHAAIVSRELGIPCVIGTKIATKVIKDGYLLDIDATHGKVNVLKKS